MRTERLSSLALVQAYRDTLMDTKSVVREFFAKKKARNFFFLIATTSWQE